MTATADTPAVRVAMPPGTGYTSPIIVQIAAALAKAQRDFAPVEKCHTASVTSQRTGKTHTYPYVTLADVVAATRNGLADNDLVVTQVVSAGMLATLLIHAPSGEWIRSEAPLPQTGDMQQLGSALTYLRRYTLMAILGVAAGDGSDDDDGQRAQPRAQQAPAAPPNEPTVEQIMELDALAAACGLTDATANAMADVKARGRFTAEWAEKQIARLREHAATVADAKATVAEDEAEAAAEAAFSAFQPPAGAVQ